jgi:hypothetical protein
MKLQSFYLTMHKWRDSLPALVVLVIGIAIAALVPTYGQLLGFLCGGITMYLFNRQAPHSGTSGTAIDPGRRKSGVS